MTADSPGRNRFGHYTAIVHGNADPEKAGRLQVVVPAVMGQEVLACWAIMGGQHFGAPASTRGRRGRGRGTFRVPPVGSQVVVVFLNGDVQAPMWLPGVWPREHVPAEVRDAYPETSVLARGEKLDVLEDDEGNLTVTAGRDNMDIELDTRGGDLVVRTDGRGGGVIKMQGGTPSQKAIRATDTIVCGALAAVFNPSTLALTVLTYTPPPSTGLPPIAMSVATGVALAPIVGVHVGGSTKVLIGGGL